MVTKFIEIRDSKALKVLQSLESINFIKFKDMPEKENKKKQLLQLKPKNLTNDDSFESLKGIWEGRDINTSKLREIAWTRKI